jgi:branched-chain amino acid transport system substrate-binding protein
MRRPSGTAARIAAATILAAVSVTACSVTSSGTPNSNVSAGPTGTPIRVGFTVSLTGSFSADGQAVLKGYQLWANDVNANGGLLGRPVKLVYLNDKSDPNVATRDYTKLITQDHVDLTLGPFSSLLTTPAGQVANKHGYALVEGSGGAPTVFGASLPNLFGVSAPVANQLKPFTKWVLSLPPGQRPRTAAYLMVDDPFADPPVEAAHDTLAKAGINTVYDNSGQTGSTAKLLEPNSSGTVPVPVLTAAADKVVAAHPQIVVIGSVDVPTVSAIINEFKSQHFNPQMIIATSGPDQGQDFLNAIGGSNANGIMVPNGWYGGFPNGLSHVMVQEYIAKYGGTASDINADVAEAYSSGQVLADAVTNVGLSNAKIIGFLHGLRQPLDTVQGPAQWSPYVAHQPSGMNTKAVSFVFQWQPVDQFVKVLPTGGDSITIKATKPVWAAG